MSMSRMVPFSTGAPNHTHPLELITPNERACDRESWNMSIVGFNAVTIASKCLSVFAQCHTRSGPGDADTANRLDAVERAMAGSFRQSGTAGDVLPGARGKVGRARRNW